MKKYLPYLLALAGLTAILVLFLTGDKRNRKQLDERVTLHRMDKRPYATWVFFRELPVLFPGAEVRVNQHEPGNWDSVRTGEGRQLYISISDRFGADREELDELISFARAGNDVLVVARYISAAADEWLGVSSSSSEISYNPDLPDNDVQVTLRTPPFTDTVYFQYPGRSYFSFFTNINSSRTQVLGEDGSGHPHFIRLRAGAGNVFVHLEPLVFSNYFLLHEENLRYLEQVASVIRPGIRNIIWDEYFLRQKPSYADNNNRKKGWMSVLMGMKNEEGKEPFRAAIWLLAGLLLLYVLLEMRRRQRPIPVIRKPRNESLDFVKTIGQLYYGKGDHLNLCRKMAAYFLEHVRSKYKLPTGNLNEEFVRHLHYKSGFPEPELQRIVDFIRELDLGENISAADLARFHRQLESFYQKA